MKNTKTRKSLSILIAVIMIMSTMSLMTIGSFAETSGDFEYTVLEDGTAEITKYNGSATELTIPSTLDGYSVTSIGKSAFRNCTSLITVTVTDSVNNIGDSAFYGCSLLNSINIPNGVLNIEADTFRDCISLENIILPDSLTNIGNRAFYGCSLLSSITIPNNVESIGGAAFYDCISLESIFIPDSVTHIGNESAYQNDVFQNTAYYNNEDNWEDGVLYINNCLIRVRDYECSEQYEIKSGTKLIAVDAFKSCRSLKSLSIPDSVINIGSNSSGDYGFYGPFSRCTSLESVTIGNGVTEIPYGSFDECTSLNTIIIGSGVTSLNCRFSDTAYYNNEDNWENGVLYIGNYLIKAKSDVISNEYIIKSGTRLIAYYAFAHCSSLLSVTIPNTVTNIGDSAFADCSSLNNVTIGNGCNSIGDNAFRNCTSLASIKIPDSVMSIGNYAFFECTSLSSVTIGNGCNSIGDMAFYRCKMHNIVIPDNTFSIGDGAFWCCSSLVNIRIPNNVSYIGESAFEDCTSLESIIVDERNQNYCSDDGVLFNKNKTILMHYPSKKSDIIDYTVPNSVTSIERAAFDYCSSLKSISIPSKVVSIGSVAFYGCNSLETVNLPIGISKIEAGTFMNCKSLNSIVIPNSVTSIESRAFYGCNLLGSIEIGSGVTNINSSDAFESTAYYNNEDNWEDGVLYVGNYLIKAKTDVIGNEYVIRNGTRLIAGYAFSGCSSLNSINIPNGVTGINNYAFYGCASLNNITIGNGCNSIGDNAFRKCTALTNIALPDNVTNIGDSAFSGCSSLNSINIPNGVTGINNYAFYGCASLTSIILPNTIKRIGAYSFNSCSSLVNIIIPDGVTDIAERSFEFCNSLESIVVPQSVNNIDYYSFMDCDSLNECIVYYNPTCSYSGLQNVITSLIIPENILNIKESAFSYYKSLSNIKISDSVTNIGAGAFHGTAYYDNENNWNNGILYIDKCLVEVKSNYLNESYVVTDGTRLIANGAFKDWDSPLKSIEIPRSVKYIGNEAIGYSLHGWLINDFIIYGYIDSAAETYANENGIKFVDLDAPEPTKYPDVADNAWYSEAAYYNAERGWITGYKNGNFGGGDQLKRQDFVVILARIAGADLTAYENVQSKMSDVVKGSYYAAAVNWAVDNGIIGGYTSGAKAGKFGVGDPITREQVCVILYRYMGSPAVTSADNTLKPFADAGKISSFAKNAVVWAIQNGVISGKKPDTLAPTVTASRAEIATIVMRMDKAGMFAE